LTPLLHFHQAPYAEKVTAIQPDGLKCDTGAYQTRIVIEMWDDRQQNLSNGLDVTNFRAILEATS
jgi:hypothetical protein